MRRADEDERFDRLKDLCHRIASEGKLSHHLIEERVSAAYGGLLAFLRRGGAYNDKQRERSAAASAIRFALSDFARAEGPLKRNGTVRYTSPVGGSYIDVESNACVADDSLEELESLILAASRRGHVHAKLAQIARMRVDGYLFHEIGSAISLTESRVHAVWNDSIPWLAQNCARLTGLEAFGKPSLAAY